MSRHQGILPYTRFRRPDCPHIYIPSIRNINRTAVNAEYSVLSHRNIGFYSIFQRFPPHVFRYGDAKVLKNRRRQIDILGERHSVFPFDTASRIPDKQRYMGNLFIVGHKILSPPVMLSQQESMIRIDDQHGIFPQTVFIHQIQDPAQALITKLCQRIVFPAHLINHLL